MNVTTAAPIRETGAGSPICSLSTIVSMAVGGGLIIILLLVLIIVLMKFTSEMKKYRRTKSLLASVGQQNQSVGSDTPLQLEREDHKRTEPINTNRVSSGTEASNTSATTASNRSNRTSQGEPPVPSEDRTTIEVREKRSSTYEDIDEIQWSINDLYESSDTDCYVPMGQTAPSEGEKEEINKAELSDNRASPEACADQSSVPSDKTGSRKLPIAEVRPVFQHRTLPSIIAHESLRAKLRPVFQMKTRSLEKSRWYVEPGSSEAQPEYQNVSRPWAETSEESSSLYEEPNETSSRTQRVSDNSNEKRAEVENCTAADSPDKQEDKSAQSSLRTENNARNLYYDAGSTI